MTERLYILLMACMMISVLQAQTPPGQGPFTVASGKQTYFAPGNLQYQPSTDTWRFAENQYDMIGNGNASVTATYTGWMDLFPWGSGVNPAAISHTTDGIDPFVDWGINAIDTFPANVWHAPSKDDWDYIFNQRPSANQLWTMATVVNVHGLILLPDDWYSKPVATTIPFVPAIRTSYTNVSYAAAVWQQMEDNGAVFLPAAGFMETVTHNVVKNVTEMGSYWTSTPYPYTYTGPIYNGTSTTYYDIKQAHELYFNPNTSSEAKLDPLNVGLGYRGRSVRLLYKETKDTLVSGCDVVEYDGQLFYRDTTFQTTTEPILDVTIKVFHSEYNSSTLEGDESLSYNGVKYTSSTTLIERDTTEHGCEKVDTVHIVLSGVKILDSLIVNEMDWIICCNNRLLRAQYPADAYKYQWYKDSLPVFSYYPEYGDYYTEDCRLEGTFHLKVTCTTHQGGADIVRQVYSNTIKIVPQRTPVSVWPNPAARGEAVRITTEGRFHYHVISPSGICVVSGDGEEQVLLPYLPIGVYIVEIQQDSKVHTQKLMVR